MINFIVVDDNVKFLEMICNIITGVMMKNRFRYKIYSFSEYDKKFMNVLNLNVSSKIYILDIETKTASGIDIARMIRKNDVDSIIIFVTVHNEAGPVVLKDDLMFLKFICKFDDFENNLIKSINKGLEIGNHRNVIRFNDHGTIYTIPIKDILYVTRDSVDRKCIIKTDYKDYRVNKSLREIINSSGGMLRQSHRCCLVNLNRVRVVNRNYIEFDNGTSIDLISTVYKKELGVVD